MADDAFAISPLSVRPTDADYESISAAFMETARGRWFLSEVARRNRNADTRMMLDAVARIESTVANGDGAQLVESLTGIRAAVEAARSAARAAADPQRLEELLAPIRRGTRVVREIAWRWRETGADGRICDLLEMHVKAMEAGCDRLYTGDTLKAILVALDKIEDRIGDLARNGRLQASRSKEAASPAKNAIPERNAEDDAVLDMIALEMGAADDEDGDDGIFAKTRNGSPQINAPSPAQASLGAALIAGGLIGAPVRAEYNPLAPLLRMTQAEKIAFFS